MYKVINRFKDLQHGGRVYEVGDTYPAEGKNLVKARAESLTKKHPKYGVAFLEEVEAEEKKESTPKKTPAKAKEKPETVEKSDE